MHFQECRRSLAGGSGGSALLGQLGDPSHGQVGGTKTEVLHSADRGHFDQKEGPPRELRSSQCKKFTSFSAALLEVLDNHKQLWNDARSSAELDVAEPSTPVEPSPLVTSPQDILDADFRSKLMDVLVRRRLVFFLHCGTPCNTFTAARKPDGGPLPLRSSDAPMGLPSLKDCDQCLVRFPWPYFLERTAEACSIVFLLGGDFLIENPLFSLLYRKQV